MPERVPLPWRTISELANAAAERFADNLAISDGPVQLSYSELVARARVFGSALVETGVQPGERVAIWAFNSVEWVIAYLGLIQAGAVLVPVNTRFKGREASDILLRSRARALVTVSDFLGTDHLALLRSADVALPELSTVIDIQDGTGDGATRWTDFLARSTPTGLAEVDRRRAGMRSDDPADILFTSGTTGIPKGVVMTHEQTLHVAFDYVLQTDLLADDRYLMINPYFHMFGLKAGILACLASGAAMFPEPVLDVGRVLRRVESDRISALPGPPTLFQGILGHPDRAGCDLSSLRVAVTGATDIPIEVMHRIVADLPCLSILNGYGLTEAGTVTGTGPADDVETVVNSCGRARPGVEVMIVDGQQAEVPAGSSGEIWVRSASVMRGYLDDPESTTAAITSDGWLKTGDIGVFDGQGRLRIVGRLKDMYIAGGFNVYPAEIENMLLRHPDIVQAGVIGIPDARLGEVGMAYLVPAPGASAAPADIVAWCRTEMANYKVPRVVEFVDVLPVNATGKLQKTVLREWAANRVRENA